MSFDVDRFYERIAGGPPWQQLIQAHLYLDHTISLLISDALAKPAAMDTGRMGFAQKLQLVDGMALLADEVISAIRVINGLRNKIAHDLTFELTPESIRNAINAVPKFLHEVMKQEAGRAKGPLTFEEALKVLAVHAEVQRTQHNVNRALSRKAELRLQDVLSRKTAV